MLLAKNWLCVNAASEGWQERVEMMERRQHQEVQVKESRWAKEEKTTKMKKEAKLLRYTLRRYKGKCDIFFGVEHRLRKQEMEEQLNKEAKKDGGSQRMQRELPIKQQAVRMVSTYQEEFLWQSTAT